MICDWTTEEANSLETTDIDDKVHTFGHDSLTTNSNEGTFLQDFLELPQYIYTVAWNVILILS